MYKKYKPNKPNKPITILECLPKDIIDNIRFWLARADFNDSLVKIKDFKQNFDTYTDISQNCFNNKLQGIFHKFESNNSNNIFQHVPNTKFTAISVNVSDDKILIPESYNVPYPCINNIFHYMFDTISTPLISSRTDLTILNITTFISKVVDSILLSIEQLKIQYRNNVAVPNINPFRHIGTVFWLDNKECFQKYLFENAYINNNKMTINTIIDIILFNLGHRPSFRSKMLQQKHRLNTIIY